MSGGIAYVYDVKNQFASLCNMEMIDLDSLTDDDELLLQDMINKHYSYTGSSVARFILNDLENQVKNFVKVFPKDYKKALKANAEKGRALKV